MSFKKRVKVTCRAAEPFEIAGSNYNPTPEQRKFLAYRLSYASSTSGDDSDLVKEKILAKYTPHGHTAVV